MVPRHAEERAAWGASAGAFWEVGMQRAAVLPSTCQGPQPWGLTV